MFIKLTQNVVTMTLEHLAYISMFVLRVFNYTLSGNKKRYFEVSSARRQVAPSSIRYLINFRSENASNMTSMVGSIVEDNREQEKPIDREKVCISNGRILK